MRTPPKSPRNDTVPLPLDTGSCQSNLGNGLDQRSQIISVTPVPQRLTQRHPRNANSTDCLVSPDTEGFSIPCSPRTTQIAVHEVDLTHAVNKVHEGVTRQVAEIEYLRRTVTELKTDCTAKDLQCGYLVTINIGQSDSIRALTAERNTLKDLANRYKEKYESLELGLKQELNIAKEKLIRSTLR